MLSLVPLVFAAQTGLLPATPSDRHVLRSFERVTSPVKHAGTYHLATGTWTREPAASALAGGGSEIVYNCTVESGYFISPRPGETWTASGRLPSTSSPNSVWNPAVQPVGSRPGSAPGCADAYTIDGFQIAYCSTQPGPTTAMTVAFHSAWNPICITPVTGPPQGGPFAFTGLPGNGSGSAPHTCWTFNVDLAGSGASFTLLADGDGAYSANTNDAFAWTFSFPSVTGTTFRAGPRIAGAPADGTGPAHPGIGWRQFPPSMTTEAAGYDGTRFDGPPGALAPLWPANGAVGLPNPGGEAGSDLVAFDGIRIDGGAFQPGCFSFGGPIGSSSTFDGPYANFHLELYSSAPCVATSGAPICAGDGLDPSVAIPCPCANSGQPGRGCASSFSAAGARLAASGVVALDAVVLQGSGMNATGTCIFLKGDQHFLGGYVFGDGVACVAGSLIRLRQKPLAAGTASFPDASDTITLSARGGTPVGSGLSANYAVYYRNAANYCTPATFNVSNGWRITW